MDPLEPTSMHSDLQFFSLTCW